MRSAVLLTVGGIVLVALPEEILRGIGVERLEEVELLRWSSAFLFAQSVLVAKMNRNRIVDERWRRVVAAGYAAFGLMLIYVTSGNPFFLLLSFCLLVAITLRTWMPVLDHWSNGAVGRWKRTRSPRRDVH